MEIYERIKARRKELGLSAETVAERLGVSPATIYRYEKNDIKKFPTEILTPLSKILRTTPAYLLGVEESRFQPPEISSNTIHFPVLGSIAAGFDALAVEDWSGDTIEIPAAYLRGRDRSEFFVLRVHGNSMYPRYLDGDLVLVLRQSTIDASGDVGAVLYENENATLKKVEFVPGEDWLRLIPINPEFMPRKIRGADLEQCRILGVPWLLLRQEK